MNAHFSPAAAGIMELKDAEGDGGSADIVTKALKDLTESVDERLKKLEAKGDEKPAGETQETPEHKALIGRLDKIEARLSRPKGEGGDEAETPIERKAFVSFARAGVERMPVDEIKALRVADGTTGGYLAPDQFVADMIKGLVEVSPLRQAARVGSTSAGAVILPKRTGTMTAKWVGETETRPGTEPTYGQLEIPIHEIACWVDVSNRLLEDSAINLESELASDFAEEFGRTEGVAFVSGDGVKKPLGVMNAPGVPAVAGGSASAIAADGLLDLLYDLPAVYRNNGAWLLNGTTLGLLRKIKDGQGNYLWQPAIAAGQPETLLGRPIVEAVDMPDVAANAFPIAYGDWGRAFRIYDRVGLSVLRDPYTQQTNGIVRFHARRRVGAAVVLPEAVRKLKIAVSL